jgi:hypothetical protein
MHVKNIVLRFLQCIIYVLLLLDRIISIGAGVFSLMGFFK